MADHEHVGGDRGSSASKKKFETVFRHANDAIFIVDVENDDIVDCNPAAVDLVEYSREELMSMPASDLHPHNLQKFLDFAETVFEEGEGWTDDITCYCKSGDIIPAEMSASVIELDGRPHIVNHIRGTSDREERDRLEALLEHSSDLITVVKPDGTIRYQSDSADNVLGHSPDELRGNVYFDYLHPDDVAAVRSALESMVERSEGSVQRQEYRFRRADGSWAWLEGIVSHRPDTTISGYLVNARDITARKESHQQAMVLNRVLRHNLRNDLNVIHGHARRLADAADPAVADEAETIASNTADLLDVTGYTQAIDDMLRTQHVPQRRQDAARIVDERVADLRERHPDVTVEVESPPEQFVTAPPKLSLAVDHVLTNAVEHNDTDSPRVTVTVVPPAAGDEYVEIVIADNGPGIPSEEQEVLLEGEEEPLKHGSGLGLWIVNWIINRSGGYVEFEEDGARGSRVTLAFPRSARDDR